MRCTDLDPGRLLKREKAGGWRETVREKRCGDEWMVRMWEEAVLDQVSVRCVGESRRWVWYTEVMRLWGDWEAAAEGAAAAAVELGLLKHDCIILLKSWLLPLFTAFGPEKEKTREAKSRIFEGFFSVFL